MFDERELRLIVGCVFREIEFMRAVEACGIPTVIQQGELAALRSKVTQLQEAEQKKKAVEQKDVEIEK